MSSRPRSLTLVDLVDPRASVERIATGFRFTEGPLWDRGGVRLELIPAAAFEGVEGLDRPGLHHVSFAVEDVHRTAESLRERGVRVTKEPFSPLEGMTLAFLDGLDGANLQLFHRKKSDLPLRERFPPRSVTSGTAS